METKAIVEAQYRQLRDLVKNCAGAEEILARMADRLITALEKKGKILTAGNGGSATDAMHMTEELVGRYKQNRRSLPSICLTADAATISCISNDFGYEQVFSRQIESLGRAEDLLVVFTTSGNSANLIKAVETARQKKIFSFAFLGKEGGQLKGRADLEWIVPHNETARIQEMHTWAMHVLLEVVEGRFAG